MTYGPKTYGPKTYGPKTLIYFFPSAAVHEWIESDQGTRRGMSLESDTAEGGPESSTKPEA